MSNDWTAVAELARTVLSRRGGVAKTAHLLDAGITALQVGGLRTRGFIERPRSGWFVLPELHWRAKCAIRVGGVLTCVSACDLLGIPVPPGSHTKTHVMLPGNAPRVRHHRSSRLYVVPGEDTEVARHWSKKDGTPVGWCTDLVGTLVELAECVPRDWWIAAVDAALHRPRDGGSPLLSEEDLHRLRELLPEIVRQSLDLVDPLAESCLETLIRLGLVRRGIGPLVLQFRPDASGWRAYEADIRVGERLLVEADGEAYHDPDHDAIRDAYLRSLGFVVLRFRYEEIVNDIESVLDRIEAALRTVESGTFVL